MAPGLSGLRHRLGLLCKRDWSWASALDSSWESLSLCSKPLRPGDEQQLWLRTNQNVVAGWYLLGIRHHGQNPETVGWLRGHGSAWCQGRPMYPVRRRWRVVRLRQSCRPLLQLEAVAHPIQLRELWLFRLPLGEARRRIQRRLRHSSDVPNTVANSTGLATQWLHYNRLLRAQARRHGWISYRTWQRCVENSALRQIDTQTTRTIDQFQLRRWPDRRPVPENSWAVVLTPGSELSPWALQAMACALQQEPKTLLLYGDEDEINQLGMRYNPRFKPAWNRELFWCDPHYSSCWAVASDLWNQALDAGNHWQTLVLTLAHHAEGQGVIRHLPLVLSHRHGTGPAPLEAKQLERVLAPLHPPGLSPVVVEAPETSGYRLQWSLQNDTLLSVVIPMRDRPELIGACLASIERYPPGCELEIVVVDNGSTQSDTHDWLANFAANSTNRRRQIVLNAPGAFNYSDLNNRAVEHCRGDVLLLLNNDVEFLSPGWGRELASNAQRPDIGCVGALLLHDDLTVQHAGVILGIGGIAAHSHQHLDSKTAGYCGRLQLPQELSAVTGACLAIKRRHWDALNGLDAVNLKVNYNDVDLCLRAKNLGLRNLYLPHVRALHHESKSRGRPEGAAYWQWRREWDFMKRRWGPLLNVDPAYSPHLTLERQDWSLALRPGSVSPR